MADLPSGTVTLFFTDVEGSTRLLQRLGDRYADLLEDHRRVIRDVAARHRGQEFGAEGDALFLAFADARAALDAAADVQRALAAHAWPDDAEIRVRIGVHTGQPRLVDGDYVGLDVHRVARLTSAAHGGQVLLSAAARERAADCDVVDLGEHRLKDLLAPERLFQLVVDGVPAVFPPPRTLGARPTNLPVQGDALVGREAELEQLRTLAVDPAVRLITLTGPGGIGKTRLALQLAADLVERFESGVFFVPVAPVHEPALVPSAIADALALREVAGESLVETLSAYLSERELLLLVDNFEQVVDAAPLLSELLATAPRLRLVATSRERLRIAGERVFEVPPLSFASADGQDAATLAKSDAVALFVSRAQEILLDFALTDANAPAVAAVCARLDGLPLAIELAAGRLPLLSPEELSERLDRRLAVLTGGARDADPRQRTLRDTIAWSFELLRREEQALYARLGVFAGGCRLADAEVVCDPEGDLGVLDGIQSLLDKSLLRQQADPDGKQRFWMLGTMREYALEQLAAREESDAVLPRHAEWALGVAEAADTGLHGADQVIWLERVEAERDNFLAALEWALTPGAGEERALLGLRLAGALGRFWYIRARIRQGSVWLERALAADPGGDPAARAKAAHALGILADESGDGDRARKLFEQALAIHRAVGDRRRVAVSLNSLGVVARNQGEPARARELLEESLRIKRELGEERGLSATMTSLGVVLVDQGDFERARAVLLESLESDERRGDRVGMAANLLNLGSVALEQGDHETAGARLSEGLRAFVEIGDDDGVAESLEGIAALSAAVDDPLRAAALAGAAQPLRERAGSPLTAPDRARLDRYLAVARGELGDEAFTVEYERGLTLGTADAVAQALELADPATR